MFHRTGSHPHSASTPTRFSRGSATSPTRSPNCASAARCGSRRLEYPDPQPGSRVGVTMGRVLVSADSHGGAPLGEMEEVAARGDRTIEREGTTARIGVRVLENAFKKNPEIHPEDRIREADLDGVVAEVVYGFTGIPEGDFAEGVRQVQAANDWSAEVYGDYLGRFAPSVCLPIPIERYGARGGDKPTEEHIAAAAAEIRRTKAMWLRPALIP